MTGAQDENILSKRLSARLVSIFFNISYTDFAGACSARRLFVRLSQDVAKTAVEPGDSLCLCGGFIDF